MKEQLKEYLGTRIKAIFGYTSEKWYYVALKTLCVIIGAPFYFLLLPLDLLNFLVYALFSWIPILNTFMLVLCRLLSIIFSIGYYIAILPDAKKFMAIEEEKSRLEMQAEEQNKSEQTNKTETNNANESDSNIMEKTDSANQKKTED